MKKYPITFLYLIFFFSLSAQDPASIKWHQINTDTVRVIFPEGLDSQAQRVAGLVHHLYSQNTRSIGDIKWKINILLHNQTSVSNGFVSSSPFRSEFFTSAPFQSHRTVGAGDWMDLLTVHEYRHVLQYMNTRQGISKAIQWLSGDLGIAATMSMAIPKWFSEGDAVVTETALSQTGRGRTPAFTAQQRAILFSNIDYSYVKWKNRSYKDLVPNHYVLGYSMCNYARNRFGNDIWNQVYSDAVRFKKLYPLSAGLKEHAGIKTKTLHKEALDDLKKRYQEHLNETGTTQSFEVKTEKHPKRVELYKHPKYTENGKLLCVKSSFRDVSQIIAIDTAGHEKSIVTLGNEQSGSYFSYANNKLVWAEFVPDPRWTHRSYNNLVVYDMLKKTKKYLTRKTKYQSPAFSPDASKIIVAEVTPDLSYHLVILDAGNGKVLQSIKSPYLPTFPQWDENGSRIIFTAREHSKNFLCAYDLKKQQFTKLSTPSYNGIGIPHIHENKIYFSADFSGIDNIYVYDLKQKQLSQLTSVAIGAYEVCLAPGSKKIVFSEYADEKGTRLSWAPLNQSYFNESVHLTGTRDSLLDAKLFGLKAIYTEGGSILNSPISQNFKTEKYSRLKHLFKLHAWNIYTLGNELILDLYSNNILGTNSIGVTTGYNFKTEESILQGSFSYTRFFPVITGSFSNIYKRDILYYNSETGQTKGYHWNDQNLYLGASLPFDLSRHTFSRSLYLGIDYSLTNSELIRNNLNSVHFTGTFSNRQYRASQQVNTRFGQYLKLVWHQGVDHKTRQLNLFSRFYYPGLLKTHALFMDVDLQSRKSGTDFYYFNDNFIYARGYNVPKYHHIYKVASNYMMPLLYPDIGINGIVFLKRIRSNFFYDYSHTWSNDDVIDRDYRSFGAELFFDVNLLDFYSTAISVRYSKLLDYDPDGLKGGDLFIALDLIP